MGKVVEIDCEKPMKLETSPKVSPNEVCIGVAVSVKNICARFITVSVKKLLHYRAGGLLQYRAFYYIIGRFITLSGSYYIIGRFLLHYRAVITVSGVYYIIGWYRLLSGYPSWNRHVDCIVKKGCQKSVLCYIS